MTQCVTFLEIGKDADFLLSKIIPDFGYDSPSRDFPYSVNPMHIYTVPVCSCLEFRQHLMDNTLSGVQPIKP